MSKIPDHIPLSHAVVLPVGINTAIVGFLDHLSLSAPTNDSPKTKQTVLIWGGSGSMGSTAIQFASASGYRVITTAGLHNHDFVKALGAEEVFDYKGTKVVEHISQRLLGEELVGVFDCVGEEASIRACAAILHDLGGGHLATVLPPPNDLPEDVRISMGELTKKTFCQTSRLLC